MSNAVTWPEAIIVVAGLLFTGFLLWLVLGGGWRGK